MPRSSSAFSATEAAICLSPPDDGSLRANAPRRQRPLDRPTGGAHCPGPLSAIVDLAPGAENNPLAARYADCIRDNVADDPALERSFSALKCTILVVPFDTGDALTLRFDLGRLVIHEGNVGIPTVTFGGPTHELLKLEELRLPRVRDLTAFGSGLASVFRNATSLFASGKVKIYGFWAHPRTVYRFIRLVTPAPPVRSSRP